MQVSGLHNKIFMWLTSYLLRIMTLLNVVDLLFRLVDDIMKDVEDNRTGKTLLKSFRMSALPSLYAKIVELVEILVYLLM